MDITIASLVGIGLLWGVTNPFIRLGSQRTARIEAKSPVHYPLMELKFWIPFLLNQCASVLYAWTLQTCSITTAVPIANSLNFLFTAITGHLLGEKAVGRKVVLGAALVCLGSMAIVLDQKKPNKSFGMSTLLIGE
uniref:EamA domain-containing protein n=1 Tax=Glossina pallidipes TaxID=7398 RepID=A0A1A9ZFT4_GLOPL